MALQKYYVTRSSPATLYPTVERDDSPLNVYTSLPYEGYQLRHQVKVLATEVSAGTIETIPFASVDCPIVTVTRDANVNSEPYNSNNDSGTFDSRVCPEQLKLVTHVTAPKFFLLAPFSSLSMRSLLQLLLANPYDLEVH